MAAPQRSRATGDPVDRAPLTRRALRESLRTATGPAATELAATGPAATGPAATGPAATEAPATAPQPHPRRRDLHRRAAAGDDATTALAGGDAARERPDASAAGPVPTAAPVTASTGGEQHPEPVTPSPDPFAGLAAQEAGGATESAGPDRAAPGGSDPTDAPDRTDGSERPDDVGTTGRRGRRGRLMPARLRGGRVSIRPFRSGDEAGLAQVCLRTAADGGDATARHAHPGLPAVVYALPYARFEPDLCLVVDDGTPEGRVSGYVLGTSDTVSFEEWCERAWWPAQRETYPLADMVEPADRAMAELVHHPRRTPRRITDRYPAHLHVDLLPHVQGGGWGRRLLEGFMAAAAAADAPAVHLGVSETNTRAVGFYARLGFALVERTDGALLLGRPL